MDMERRYCPFASEFRADGDGSTIKGHFTTFNDRYDLGMFEETIAPGALDGVLGDDVRALFNHDPNQVLGRTSAGTLRLSVDKRGGFSEIDLPASATMLREAIERGDVTEMSFGFTVKKDQWETLDEDTGKELRTILEIEKLYDVSPVTFPANPNTDVALRSRDAAREEAREIQGQTTENSKEVVAPKEEDAQQRNKNRLRLLDL